MKGRDRNTDPGWAVAVCLRSWSFRDLIQRSLRRLPGRSRATGTIAARLGLTCRLDLLLVPAFRERGTPLHEVLALLQSREAVA